MLDYISAVWLDCIYIIRFFFYRLEFRTENEYWDAMNTLQVRQSRAWDNDLLTAIRCRERMATIDRVIGDIWRIYDFVKKNK